MYYSDLPKYVYYLKKLVESVLNAGWLDAAYDFHKGPVVDGFLERLEDIISSAGSIDVHVNRIRGIHSCSVCGEQGPFETRVNNVVLRDV